MNSNIQELIDAVEAVQDWKGTRVGAAIEAAEAFGDYPTEEAYNATCRALAHAKLVIAELVEAAQDALRGSVDARPYPDGPCLDKEVRDALTAAVAFSKKPVNESNLATK